jgi:hypothetical protein
MCKWVYLNGATKVLTCRSCRALNHSAYYLQPFADVAHAQFGMNIAILMCGPIPDRGGRIEVRSVHAGFSNGLVPRIWSDFDRAGFDVAQRSFVAFTRNCFSKWMDSKGV